MCICLVSLFSFLLFFSFVVLCVVIFRYEVVFDFESFDLYIIVCVCVFGFVC